MRRASRARPTSMLLVVVMIAGLVAIAVPYAHTATRDGPTLKRTTATVVAAVKRSDFGFCSGPGGEHFKVDLQIRGPITSNDHRLAGEFFGHVRVLVKRAPVDSDILVGHGRDDFVIRDAHGTKARGTGFFVFDFGKPLKGMLFARLRDGSSWISNFSVANQLVSLPIVLDDTLHRLGVRPIGFRGPVVVRIGGQDTFNPSDPGLIQHAACSGGLGADPLREQPIYPQPAP